ncbi:MAG: PorV/PorQ family protein [Salinivirgaceae bacterium]|nr:PorV/PorQ family protein [Salinivirgaceae bacterium]
MKKISILIITVIGLAIIAPTVHAGNEERAGEAGASELLLNPWAASSGFGNANVASVQGLEGIFLNVAGTAFTNKTELGFTYTDYLSGAGIGINSFAFSQKVGESGAFSASVVSYNFGELDRTLVEAPDGNGTTFKPTYTNITVGYAREFSNAIYGGAAVKIINEGISNSKATGIAIDAGIQYVTGERDQFRFGITMQNVGPNMKFSGDGLSFKGTTPNGTIQTLEYRAREFELPSLIRMGLSYDLFLAENHNLLVAGNFTSNSFTKDNLHLGLEYGFMDYLRLRGGFIYEDGIFDEDERATVFTGLTGGLSVLVPLSKENGSRLAIDYSYRATAVFDGVHSIGARIIL